MNTGFRISDALAPRILGSGLLNGLACAPATTRRKTAGLDSEILRHRVIGFEILRILISGKRHIGQVLGKYRCR
jgi:hypothetical protein